MLDHPGAAMLFTDHVAVSVQRVGIGNYYRGIKFEYFGSAVRDSADANPFSFAVVRCDLFHFRALQNSAAEVCKRAAQVVGEFLRTALGIVVAEEV